MTTIATVGTPPAASIVGLIRAELLKIRRRQATYVILAVALLLMVAIFFVVDASMARFHAVPGAAANVALVTLPSAGPLVQSPLLPLKGSDIT